jgi:hydrogenase maturation protease
MSKSEFPINNHRSSRELSHETSITVVGIGNEFRGDDAVGLMVLRQLKGSTPTGARLIELAGDESHLLELMRSADAMIIVDAVQSSAPAGTIFRVDTGREPAPKDFLLFSTHAFETVTAIETARALGILPRETLLYGIVGKDFSYKVGMTEEVEDAIEVIREGILEEIYLHHSRQSVGK